MCGVERGEQCADPRWSPSGSVCLLFMGGQTCFFLLTNARDVRARSEWVSSLVFLFCVGVGVFGFGQIEVCSDGLGPEMWRVSMNAVLLTFGFLLVKQFANSFSLVLNKTDCCSL